MKKLIPLLSLCIARASFGQNTFRKMWLMLPLATAILVQQGTAQTTNVARPVVSMTRLEGGVFVNYSAEIGRLYRLESSTTLTNWTLVEERVADATNMQFFVENTNITFNVPTNSGGGGGTSSPPSFNRMSMASSESAEKRPLPYPWEPAYNPSLAKMLFGFDSAAESFADGGASTESSLVSGSQESTFYRVRCPDVRIAFPNWVPFTDQFLNFTVWTAMTNAGSTYRFVLYRDGAPVFTNAGAVPVSGFFGVADPGYNAANWPFTGYYNANNWKLAGGITSAPPVTNVDQTIQFEVATWQRKSFPSSRGLVANQHGLLIFTTNDWVTLEEDFTEEMLQVYDYNLSGSIQVDLDFVFRDPPQYVLQNLNSAADWTRLKTCLFTNPLSHFHYFGHGAPDRIGYSAAGNGVTLAQVKKSSLTNNPLHYVGLDGCQVVENSTDMLAAFVGYKTKITRLQAAARGFVPGYGWGWKNAKPVGYRIKGVLYDKHFYFIKDFYMELNHRNAFDFLDRTYEQARIFALDPNGGGWGGSPINHNTEGEGFDYVGCYGCYFDDF